MLKTAQQAYGWLDGGWREGRKEGCSRNTNEMEIEKQISDGNKICIKSGWAEALCVLFVYMYLHTYIIMRVCTYVCRCTCRPPINYQKYKYKCALQVFQFERPRPASGLGVCVYVCCVALLGAGARVKANTIRVHFFCSIKFTQHFLLLLCLPFTGILMSFAFSLFH